MALQAAFVLLAAWMVGVGWLLSAFCFLQVGPYSLLLVCGVFLALVSSARYFRFAKWRWHRWRRASPLGYVFVTGLALAGGLLHDPANFDGLSYRGPRVLHWLSEGGWHWIHTADERMNTRGTVFEWISVPFYGVFRSDRLLFLVNWFAYLLLPGVLFRFFRGLSVGGRASWWWMWVFPLGLGYALQAGSIGNDLLGTLFFLGAMAFLLPPKPRVPTVWEMAVSILAFGLATGIKATNLVLGLPWLMVLLGHRREVVRRWRVLGCVALVGVLVSYAPTGLLNHHFSGDWTGMRAESDEIQMKSPLAGALGNAVLLLVQNVQPPIIPLVEKGNAWLRQIVPGWIQEAFPGQPLGFSEMQLEEGAGLGLPLLLAMGLGLTLFGSWPRWSPGLGAVLGGYLAAGIYMVNSALGTAARLLLPFYPLLVVPFIWCIRPRFYRSAWALVAACMVVASSAVLVALTPPRPLLKAEVIVGLAECLGAPNRLVERVKTVYAVYGSRGRAFDPVLERLGNDERVVGFYSSGDTPETALWQPFGRRRVVHLKDGDSRESLAMRGVQVAVVSDLALALRKRTLDDW